MISIKVNDTVHLCKKDSSIETVLTELSVATFGVAVALNQSVIIKSNWNSQLLKEGDEILVIKATQGG